MHDSLSLCIPQLRAAYRAALLTPRAVVERLLAADAADERRVWITRLDRDTVLRYVTALDPAALDRLPLYGIPFVIKDNIDLAGTPTTAGCPAFAYVPARSAVVVERLIAAGAIPLGKTNLDQFATGLVGTRSPYGACRNSFDSRFVSGGSSSGSAVAVATGLASFSLGTDTAGSGRVPAAFNNLIGLKPSLGRLSTRGVVPACRSLDCVSIFALTADDAACVFEAAQAFDPSDPFSRPADAHSLGARRVGVPRTDQLQFFGDAEYAELFGRAIERLVALGYTPVTIDFEPFLASARLLYEGPWVAERFAAVGGFVASHPESVHPVTRQIIDAGRQVTAVAAFEGGYRLREVQRMTETTWQSVDVIATPTAGTIYRIDEVERDPLRLNSNLGVYTNFMNLLDLAGVAVPGGFRGDGLPFGITLVGRRGSEGALLGLAAQFHHAGAGTLGATRQPIPPPEAPCAVRAGEVSGEISLVVCGAHMQGLPLNHQLRDRGGRLVKVARTTPRYRLFALPGGPPHRPGLVRVPGDGAAASIDVEVWALPPQSIGSLLCGVPAPLCVGWVELDSGEWVQGFLCESHALPAALDITHYGGWRRYLAEIL